MKLSDKAKQVIGTVAPVLGTALGGPLGGAVGAILASVFGTDDEKIIDAALSSANPEALLKLKESEKQFLIRMRELGIEEEKLAYSDTADARRAYTTTKDPLVAWIGGGTVAGFFCMVALLLLGQVTADTAILGALIGYASAKADMVLGFYFGSSKGSQTKTDALVDALKDKKHG